MSEDVKAYEPAGTAVNPGGRPREPRQGSQAPSVRSKASGGQPTPAAEDVAAPAPNAEPPPDAGAVAPETPVDPATRPAPTPEQAAETVRLFEQAVRDHSRRLIAIARAVLGTSSRASPEDVVQQALTNLYQHRDRYDWHEPGGLMKRSVVNEALRILRQPKMSLVGEEHPDDHRDQDPADVTLGNETVVRVREAIAKLPEHYRAALVLCEYDRMPYADIAKTLDASVPQVKTWIFRARRQLEEMLKDYAANAP